MIVTAKVSNEDTKLPYSEPFVESVSDNDLNDFSTRYSSFAAIYNNTEILPRLENLHYNGFEISLKRSIP